MAFSSTDRRGGRGELREGLGSSERGCQQERSDARALVSPASRSETGGEKWRRCFHKVEARGKTGGDVAREEPRLPAPTALCVTALVGCDLASVLAERRGRASAESRGRRCGEGGSASGNGAEASSTAARATEGTLLLPCRLHEAAEAAAPMRCPSKGRRARWRKRGARPLLAKLWTRPRCAYKSLGTCLAQARRLPERRSRCTTEGDCSGRRHGAEAAGRSRARGWSCS